MHSFLRLSGGACGAPASFTRALLALPAPALIRKAVQCLQSRTVCLRPAGWRKGPVTGSPSFPVPDLLTVCGGQAASQLNEAGRRLMQRLARARTAEGWGGAADSDRLGQRGCERKGTFASVLLTWPRTLMC